MRGTLFLVVGPSGVGKDTLLDGARAELSGSRWFRFPRRVITRPASAGGEDHTPATEAEYSRLLADGAFLHHWDAHGLRYGIPAEAGKLLEAGVNVVLNGSRSALASFREKVQPLVTIQISASPGILAARLRARGRESEEEIARRLARVTEDPTSDGALMVLNDGTVEQGISALIDAIAGAAVLKAEVCPGADDVGLVCRLPGRNAVASRLLGCAELAMLSKGARSVAATLLEANGSLDPDQCVLSSAACAALGAKVGDIIAVERIH